MEAVSNFLNAVPGPVALALMLGGFIFYALGCIRLGYGAAVKPTVLQLIEQAEKDIHGTKKARSAKPGWLRCSARPWLQASMGVLSRGPSPMRPSASLSSFSLTESKKRSVKSKGVHHGKHYIRAFC